MNGIPARPPTEKLQPPAERIGPRRAILVCIIAICALTAIAITGMLSRTLQEGQIVIVLGLIAAIAGIGSGAHMAAAQRFTRYDD